MDYPTPEIAVKNEFFDLLDQILNNEKFSDNKTAHKKLEQFFNTNPFFNIDEKNGEGRTALSLFCEFPLKTPKLGHNTLQTLLDLGAEVDSLDYSGYTPIMYAVSTYEKKFNEINEQKKTSYYSYCHSDNVTKLLSYEPNLSFSRCQQNALTLIKDESLKAFLNDFERTRVHRLNEKDCHTKNNHLEFLDLQWHKLCTSIENGDLNKIKKIIKEVPEIIHMRSCDHSSFLHTATFHKNKDAVQYFLDKGVDPWARNCYGETPLYTACKRDALEIAKYFSYQFSDVSPFKNTPVQCVLSKFNFTPNMEIDGWWSLMENNFDTNQSHCVPYGEVKISQTIFLELIGQHLHRAGEREVVLDWIETRKVTASIAQNVQYRLNEIEEYTKPKKS